MSEEQKEYELLISRHQNKLMEQYDILKQCEDNPELILTDLFAEPQLNRSNQPYYNYITKALNVEGISFHDLQKYLIKKVKEYFHPIIDENTELVKEMGSYPSTIIIEYKGYSILRFNFYFQSYSEGRLLSNYKKSKIADIESLQIRLERLKKKLREYNGYRTEPITMLSPKSYYNKKSFLVQIWKDLWTFVTKQGLILEKVNDIVEESKEEIGRIEDRIKKTKEKIKEYDEIEDELEEVYNKWKQIFDDLGYKFNK